MKYTFIGNNCSGASIYKHTNNAYDNPFMWSIISPNDYIKLLKNYYAIDYANISLLRVCDSQTYKLCKKFKYDFHQNSICLLLDNLIEVYFPHHTYSNENISHLQNRFKKFDVKSKEPFFIIDGFAKLYSKVDIEDALKTIEQFNYNGICVSNYQIDIKNHVQIIDQTENNGIEVAKRYIVPELMKLEIL